MVETQKQRLCERRDAGLSVAWVPDLDAIPADSITGVFLSNELVDAFPVHRVVKRPLGLREIFVGWDGSRFIEIEAPLCSSALEAYVARLAISLEVGQQAEVNLEALEWMRQAGARLRRGLVVTIDYGHAASDLFAPARKTGTLLGYYRHTVSDSPYVRVGQQDLTAHVDFTSLALAGQDVGLEVTGFTHQLHLLLNLGIESNLAGVGMELSHVPAMRELLRPDGMGTTYKVLIQHKGMRPPQLDGLRTRPFFRDVLFAPLPHPLPRGGRDGWGWTLKLLLK